MQHVDVRQLVEAPRQAVWDRYTDYASWTDWAGLGRVRLARQGNPVPDGVGAVRVISNAGFEVFEEVLSWDPPRRMTYRVVKGGIPIKDHFGEVILEPHENATMITWRCRFRSRIPGLGLPFRWLVTRLFRNALRRLSRTPFPGCAATPASGAAAPPPQDNGNAG